MYDCQENKQKIPRLCIKWWRQLGCVIALLFDSVATAGCKRAIKFQVASIKCNYWDKEKDEEEKTSFLSRLRK